MKTLFLTKTEIQRAWIRKSSASERTAERQQGVCEGLGGGLRWKGVHGGAYYTAGQDGVAPGALGQPWKRCFVWN